MRPTYTPDLNSIDFGFSGNTVTLAYDEEPIKVWLEEMRSVAEWDLSVADALGDRGSLPTLFSLLQISDVDLAYDLPCIREQLLAEETIK